MFNSERQGMRESNEQRQMVANTACLASLLLRSSPLEIRYKAKSKNNVIYEKLLL